MTTTTGGIQRLAAFPNNYPWGPVGSASLAARLAKSAATPEFKLDEKEHYAELWMGTHPTSPSRLWSSSQELSSYLSKNTAALGSAKKFAPPFTERSQKEKGHVPFLFKILCANQALPLQVHPNKELAAKLHKENPDQFPDTNHKPEIAVCLSDRFLGFAGFRPLAEIRDLIASAEKELESLPSAAREAVKAFVGDGADSLRPLFQAFVEMDGEEVSKAVNTFTGRVACEGTKAFNGDSLTEEDKTRLVEATAILEECNPRDGSIFVSILFMNLMELKKGEGMYVGADGPHAWLKGDIVELMATSDNVLNVGFTDEKDDTRLVARSMTATPKSPAEIMLDRKRFSKGQKGNTTVYQTPFEEFSIMHIEGEESLDALSGPAIAIVTKGAVSLGPKGERGQVQGPEGSVWFIPAAPKMEFSEGGEVWIAFYDGEANEEEAGAK